MRLELKNIIKIISFGILLAMIPQSVKASHIIGGEIQYKCLGGNQYEITVNVYRDCFFGKDDAPFDDPASVGIFDLNTNDLLIDMRIPFMGDDTLDSFLADPCFIVPPTVCVHTTTYRDTVELLPRAGGYRAVYQRCCRNQTVNNIILPDRTGATYEIVITERALNECNASPVFKEWPPIFICAGTEINYDHGAVDVQGDSLVYRLCTPNEGASFGFPLPQPPNNPPYDTLVWKAPYNLNNILGSGRPLAIDPNTGLLTGRPDDIGQFVVGICIEEYRNGTLLSRTIRDFQYNVGLCGQIFSSIQSPAAQCDNLEVDFDNDSQFADEYLWIFDYPNMTMTSTEVSPTFTYPDTGTYRVALIAEPTSVCADTSFVDLILQNNSLNADFEIVLFDCTDSTQIVITDRSVDSVSPVVSWNWTFTFPDGSTQTSTMQNPIFSTMISDTIDIRLDVESQNGCLSTVSKKIPTQIFDPGSTIPDSLFICQGQSVELNPNGFSNYNYSWTPATGLDQTDVFNPTATPTVTTTYTVDIFQNLQFCRNISDVTVVVQPGPTLDFGSELNCDNRTISFTNNSVSAVNNYTWSFGDPAGTTSNELNPDFTYPVPGTYTVTLNLDQSASFCDAPFTKDVIVEDRDLDADFTLEYVNCEPGNLEVKIDNGSNVSGHNVTEYNWNFGGSLGTATGPNQTLTFSTSQVLTVDLKIVTDQGCNDNISKDFDINLVEQLPDASQQTCAADSIELNPSFNPNYTYEWSPSTGLSNPNSPNPKVALGNSQDYTVKISAFGADTCQIVHDVAVFVPPALNLTASDDELTCDASATLFANSSSNNIEWLDANTNAVVGTGGTLTVQVSGQNTYIVRTGDSFGCEASKVIQVAGGPVDVDFPTDQALCIGEAYTVGVTNLDANDDLQYSWNPGNRIISGGNTANPTIDESPGNFDLYVDIVSQYGCRYADTLNMVFVDPAAMDFDYEVQCDGETVEFNNLTANGFDFRWNFGDLTTNADTSQLSDPSYSYPGLGTYQVALTIPYNVSCLDTIIKTVDVSDRVLDADFDVEYLNCDENEVTIQFTDRSFSLQNNITSSVWDFGPRGNPTGSVVTFTLTADEVINANLFIENAADCADTMSQVVDFELFQLDLPNEPLVQCEGFDIFLNPNGNPNYIYEWTPANRVDDPTAANPMFTGTESTTFSVRILNIGFDTCEVVKTVDVEVPDPIRIGLDADTTTCGSPIVLQPSLNVSVDYSWTNPQGDDLGDTPTLTVNPQDTAVFILNVEDPSECTLSDTITVVNRQVDAMPNGNIDVCQGYLSFAEVTNFDPDDVFTSITWTPLDKIILGQGTPKVQVSTDDPGQNIYRVFIENQFGCKDTVSVIQNVAAFESGGDRGVEICSDVATEINPDFNPNHQYEWIPPTGLSDPNVPNPTATLMGGTTTYTAVISEMVGALTCIDTVQVAVDVQTPIQLQVTPDDTLCQSQLLTLEVFAPLAGLDFEWSLNPTFDPVISDERTLLVNNTGVNTFYVRGFTQDSLMCEYMGDVTISMVPIDVTIDPDTVVCFDVTETIDLTNNNPDQNLTYIWSPTTGILSGANTNSVEVNLTNSTTYNVEIENQYECKDTLTVNVDVSNFGGQIDVTATPDSIIAGGESQLEATFVDGVTYNWTPPATLDDESINDPIARPEETTIYTVDLADEFGCVDSRTVTVVVFDPICQEPAIFLPNAFSPNRDGENDVLELLGLYVEEMHLAIYNRWGQLVFESRDQSFGWDGTFKGEELSPDVYGFYLTVKCIDGEEYFKKGNISLIR